MMSLIRRYLISGLLVWLPIWVTFLGIHFLIEIMDESLRLIPKAYQPDHLLGFHIPGLGLIFTILILFFTGMFAANFLGRRLVALWDSLVGRIPLVRSIYSGVKKTVETMFTSKGQAFRKVLLIEYPRQGSWSIAFLTGSGCSVIDKHLKQEMVSVFVPTTPNPTSGFLIMLPKDDVYELDMSVDEALKMVISLGVVQPDENNVKLKSKRKRKLVTE